MVEQRSFICVTCPVGCSIDATLLDGRLLEAHGQACKRGLDFVKEELTAPKRVLTSTVQVRGGVLPLVPVRTRTPMSKGRLLEVATLLREIVLEAPVEEHQIVVRIPKKRGATTEAIEIVTTRGMMRGTEG